jgi:prephenate dehydrogenase
VANAFERVAIIGTGLIGTSLALALKAQRDPARISGFDPNAEHRRGAAAQKTPDGRKAFDHVSGNLVETVRSARLIVISTPVRAMEWVCGELGALAEPGTVVTDTGSTKHEVLTWAEKLLPEPLEFVGGHPMAGRVTAGPWEADATIFQNATYCLCPLPRTKDHAVERLVKFVESLGAAPYFLDAQEHDGLVAAVSHLPYLGSVALVETVARRHNWREAAVLAAGGFATASHLTESDPQMFADICLTNREAVTRQLDELRAELAEIRKMVASGDESIKRVFEQAQARHREWVSGRAAEGGRTRETVHPAAVRPQGFFMPGRLGDLIRGRREERDST